MFRYRVRVRTKGLKRWHERIDTTNRHHAIKMAKQCLMFEQWAGVRIDTYTQTLISRKLIK